jgi:hypothetical protein
MARKIPAARIATNTIIRIRFLTVFPEPFTFASDIRDIDQSS